MAFHSPDRGLEAARGGWRHKRRAARDERRGAEDAKRERENAIGTKGERSEEWRSGEWGHGHRGVVRLATLLGLLLRGSLRLVCDTIALRSVANESF